MHPRYRGRIKVRLVGYLEFAVSPCREALPQVLAPSPFDFRMGAPPSHCLPKTDGRLECSSQSKIIDACSVPPKNLMAAPAAGLEYRPANLAARSEKEARRGWPPAHSERIEFVCHGERRGSIGRFPRNGKSEQEQQPLPSLPLKPIVRAGLDDHW